jgi:uncharacterized protein YjbJ (UPF0337 family)
MGTTEKGTQPSTSTPEMFAQQWPHLRQQVKGWWDRLTEADLEQVAGDKERLVRAIQGRYGYARERTEQEVDRLLGEVSDASVTSRIGRLAEAAASSAQGLASEATKTASEVGTMAQKMATTAAATVSDTVTRAGQYLPEVPTGLAGLIRRYPVPSLMLGMGLGFLLGRSLGWVSDAEAEDESRQQREAGYPGALIQCSRCSQMIRQVDMVHHSATCTGSGVPTTGGSTS